MPDTFRNDRRRFLTCAIATVPVAGLGLVAVSARPIRAQEADLPQAEDGHAWEYVNDAADTDSDLHEAGQVCANCVFWTEEVGDGWGGCQHPDFEGVLVNAEGWCEAYVEGTA